MTKPDSILYFLLSNFNRCTDKATAENEQTLVGGWLSNTLFVHIAHTHITWLYGWGAALSSDSVFGSPPHCQSVINGSNWLNCVFEPANAPHSLQRHSDPRNGMASCVIIHEWWQDHMEMRKGQVVRFASGCVLTVDNDSLSGSGGEAGGRRKIIQLEWKVRTGFYVLGETEVKLWILFVINSGPFLPTNLITIRYIVGWQISLHGSCWFGDFWAVVSKTGNFFCCYETNDHQMSTCWIVVVLLEWWFNGRKNGEDKIPFI